MNKCYNIGSKILNNKANDRISFNFLGKKSVVNISSSFSFDKPHISFCFPFDHFSLEGSQTNFDQSNFNIMFLPKIRLANTLVEKFNFGVSLGSPLTYRFEESTKFSFLGINFRSESIITNENHQNDSGFHYDMRIPIQGTEIGFVIKKKNEAEGFIFLQHPLAYFSFSLVDNPSNIVKIDFSVGQKPMMLLGRFSMGNFVLKEFLIGLRGKIEDGKYSVIANFKEKGIIANITKNLRVFKTENLLAASLSTNKAGFVYGAGLKTNYKSICSHMTIDKEFYSHKLSYKVSETISIDGSAKIPLLAPKSTSFGLSFTFKD